MVNNGRKIGISMVALVITIIVLIVLTSAVVITGIGAPKQAQLATFYSNIDTVQELVSLKMSENMIEGALAGHDNNYKWEGIVENPGSAFAGTLPGIGEKIELIQSTLLEKTTIAEGEKEKYYVGKSGKVYYKGFEYEGNTYYNKERIAEGINKQIEIVEPEAIVTRANIVAEPTEYYGAYVNYTKTNGLPFKALDETTSLQWRIFYADEQNIYITTSGLIGDRNLATYYNVNDRKDAIDALLANNAEYVNNDCAEWAHDGIDFTRLAASYNNVKGANIATLQLDGNETTGFYIDNVSEDVNATNGYNRHVSRLSGLQKDLYNWGGSMQLYWLASPSADVLRAVLRVSCDYSYVNYRNYGGSMYGIRPLVCLKSNVQLEKYGDTYEIGIP